MKHSFEHVDGRIYLVTTTLVWGDSIVKRHDITDEIIPVIDNYLNTKLGLTYYKRIDGVITYIGEE